VELAILDADALTAGLPILTRNAEHFRRVPGLKLIRPGA
jgi:predicted nucleic acid-binding protein